MMKQDSKRFWKGQRVLVISPHPDDEVYGCGGTMAKARALGAEVSLMIFSVGDLKFFETQKIVTAKERLKEVGKVSKKLRLKDYEVLYTDAQTHLRLDAIPRRDLVSWIETRSKVAMQKIQPTLVCIPAPSYNQDHEAVFRACLTACRIHAGGIKATPRHVLVYDSPTLYWNEENRVFRPNFYVDITDYLKAKMALVRCYSSQSRHAADPTSRESIIDLAKVRGREAGLEACEAFKAYRMVF